MPSLAVADAGTDELNEKSQALQASVGVEGLGEQRGAVHC